MPRQPILLAPPPRSVSTSPAAQHVPPHPARLGKQPANKSDLDEVALDLVQFALDLAGIFDPTPIADGSSALISLGRGKWFDAIVSGVSMVPYIGDLAKAGKLPGYLQSIERAVALAERSGEAMRVLLPGFKKLEAVLDLIPAGANRVIDAMRARIKRVINVEKVAQLLPDISKHFKFRVYEQGGKTYQEAAGKLGVPGKVMRHRNPAAQSHLSAGTGDDAGHLIGDRFGAPGGGLNLTAQNRKLNRGWGEGNKPDWSAMPGGGAGFKSGGFKGLEDEWARKLEGGTGIEVVITDVTRAGEARPFMRRAEWREIAPDGSVSTHSRAFANTHTEASRTAQNIPSRVAGPQHGNVTDLAAERAKRR